MYVLCKCVCVWWQCDRSGHLNNRCLYTYVTYERQTLSNQIVSLIYATTILFNVLEDDQRSHAYTRRLFSLSLSFCPNKSKFFLTQKFIGHRKIHRIQEF